MYTNMNSLYNFLKFKFTSWVDLTGNELKWAHNDIKAYFLMMLESKAGL